MYDWSSGFWGMRKMIAAPDPLAWLSQKGL